MPFSINDFKAKFKGGARPHLFDVTLISPLNFIGVPASEFEFMCKATSQPAKQLEKIAVPTRGGREFYVAGDSTFPDWTVTIINDVDQNIRKAFEAWGGKIQGHESNLNKYGSANPQLYKADAILNRYDQTGMVTASYQLVGLFPLGVPEIPLAYESKNSLEEFQITFSMDYWLPAGIDAPNLANIL
jgi:hypothetical protein